METIDMKKLETAIVYLQRIAEGHNPINNMPADDDSVLNNPNVIRCMYFVRDVLEEVKKNGGQIGRKTKKIEKMDFPVEAAKTFSYKSDKPISVFTEQLNERLDENVYKKLTHRRITEWLLLKGYLKEEYSQDFDKMAKFPTEAGKQIGIYMEKRTGSMGREYHVVMYGKNAQEYIVQNLEKILSGEVN